MKNSWIAGLFAFVAAFAAVSIAADTKVDFTKLKCLMSGASAKEAQASDWKDGKVYFCCENCLKKFDGDKKAKAAAKPQAGPANAKKKADPPPS